MHGWEGTPDLDWKPWLKQELLEKDYQVDVPAMPNAVHPTLDEWLLHLQQTVGSPNKETILVGHSLGVITILRYLEGLKQSERIGAAFFVAGFSEDLEYEEYKGELSSFFPKPVNFEEIKRHCDRFGVLHSEDDEWVDIKHAHIFEEKLGATAIIQQGKGHYGPSDGATELPALMELIEELT